MALFRKNQYSYNVTGEPKNGAIVEAAAEYAGIKGSSVLDPDWNIVNDPLYPILPVNNDANALLTPKKKEDFRESEPFIGSFIQRDIAQSHHFRINISDKIPVEFTSRSFDKFLPVKSISFDEITFEHLSIPVGIFGDFPVLHRRKMGRFSLTLYDTADDRIEHALQKWENDCFPQGKYVSYLSQMVGTMKYASYSVEGKLNRELSLLVIPADSHRVSRSYEENNAKLITIGLVIVGTVGARTSGVSDGKDEMLLSGDNVTPVTNEQSLKGYTPVS